MYVIREAAEIDWSGEGGKEMTEEERGKFDVRKFDVARDLRAAILTLCVERESKDSRITELEEEKSALLCEIQDLKRKLEPVVEKK